MLNLKRRLVCLERRTLWLGGSLGFDWSQIGEIPEEVLRSLSMETLRLLVNAIEAEGQGRRLTLPEMKATTHLFRLRNSRGARESRIGWREYHPGAR